MFTKVSTFVKVIRDREILKNCYKLEKIKEIRKLHAVWDPSWMVGQKIDNSGKTGELCKNCVVWLIAFHQC